MLALVRGHAIEWEIGIADSGVDRLRSLNDRTLASRCRSHSELTEKPVTSVIIKSVAASGSLMLPPDPNHGR